VFYDSLRVNLRKFIIDAVRPVRFRGKYRVINLFAPNQGMVTADVFGARFELDLSDWMERHIYCGSFELPETALLLDYLKPGMTVIDAGANVGYYTALAAKCVGPEGLVFAFEPSPSLFTKLSEMIARNRLTQVRAMKSGLSNTSGTQPLYHYPGKSGSISWTSPSMVSQGTGPPAATVPTTTIDEFMHQDKVDEVNLLKLNVEGWEPRILEGAEGALKGGRIKAIICEFNEYWLTRSGSSSAMLWKQIIDFGFKLQSDLGTENFFFTL
jgi:FkbM family methyltransferase